MKVSVVFEFNSTNNSSADTNLERRHQPGHLQILSKVLIKVARELATWQFKEELEETKILMVVE